jgi:hypothetical protein
MKIYTKDGSDEIGWVVSVRHDPTGVGIPAGKFKTLTEANAWIAEQRRKDGES